MVLGAEGEATAAMEGAVHHQSCSGRVVAPSQGLVGEAGRCCLEETDKRAETSAGLRLSEVNFESPTYLLCSQAWGAPRGGYC